MELLGDDEIQTCARDTQRVTREEVGNWDMAGGTLPLKPHG